MKIRPILIFSHIFFENSLQFQKLCLPLQPQTRKIGAIAQLVEQRTENPCVPGSIPGGTTLRKSKSLQTPDFQTKSGVFLFPRNAKNGNIFPFSVEQKVEQKGGRKISTSKASFALICNVLRIKKARMISYFCINK